MAARITKDKVLEDGRNKLLAVQGRNQENPQLQKIFFAGQHQYMHDR
jgi:hypothetical protein